MSDLRYLAIVAAIALAAPVMADDLGDPTQPTRVVAHASPATPVERAPSWRLESIIVSPGRRLAVINDRVVGVSDRVGGATVIEILPYEVRLEYRGEIRRIALLPAQIKRPATR